MHHESVSIRLHTIRELFADPAVIYQAGTERLTFGIAAPLASQGASLAKDHGPDPASIVRGKPLDVKDHHFETNINKFYLKAK
jgi:hypothetical protein